MKKGQVYEATVERVDFPGKGIARTEEGPVTVKNCLPGQKIKLSVSKVRNGRAEGRLLEVMEKSPLETGQPCSHFGLCGGCTYLSLPYEEQLRVKEGQVKRLLDACLDRQKADWRWEGIKGSPAAYGYRNKMEFSFGDEVKDGPLALGMHKRGSFYDVVTVEDCRIVDEDYRLILKTVLEYFSEPHDFIQTDAFSWRSDGKGGQGLEEDGRRPGGLRYYHRLRHEGYLRHLLVRKAAGTGEILVALVTTSQDPWGNVAGGAEISHRPGILPGEGASDVAVSPFGTEGRAAVSDEPGNLHGEGLSGDALPGGAEGFRESVGNGGDASFGSPESRLIEGFRERLLDLERNGRLKGRFAGILHIVNDSLADVVQSDRTDVLYGQDFFYEELLGLRFKVSLFSFFQTNTHGAEVLYETAREYIGELGSSRADRAPDKVVYDLYSGTGTIAQLLASVAGKVIGVEIVEEAVLAARKNAEMNGLENCEFIAGDVLKVLDTIEEKPDFIVLDPPRDGIHPKALQRILSYGVERILYISCKPTSLMRDLEVFLERGYVVERAVCVDQFPWTANIEVVCVLSRRELDADAEIGMETEVC